MSTNTSGGTTTSFSNTPQAQGDTFTTANGLLITEESICFILDVMANDLGGNAKVLWSLDNATSDSTATKVYAPSDLLTQDTARVEATSNDYSAQGAHIWITADGKVGYDTSTFNSTVKASLQALAVGETLTDTFTYAIRLSNGTLSWTTATVVFAGVNDIVTITPALTNAVGAVTEDANTTPSATDSLSASGTIAFNDVDASDTHTASFVASVGNTTALGMFSLAAVNEAPGAANGSVQWTYNLNNAAAQYLAAGQTATETYTVTVDDGHGGTVTQDVVITITGTNDAPTITSGAQTGSATERADHAVDENAYTHAASGAVAFNDVDTLDTHSASFAPQALGYLGSFTLDPVNQAGDSVGWSFSVADSVLDSLQAGQVLTQTYTVTVDDGHGGTVTQDVVITITGTNDAPTITSGAQTGSATERADHAVDENAYTHAASGAVTFNDVDTLDTHSASFAPQALGYLGSFTLDPVNQAGDSVGWSFSVADSVLDSLQAGQVLTQTYTVTVDDGHGGTVTQDVVITITGTNDAPTITSGAQTGSATERADHAVDENAYTHAASGAVTFNDVDTLDTHSASFAPQALGYLGSFTLDPVNQAGDSVGWSFSVADSVLDSLQAGQVLTQTYTVTVDDGHGGTVTQDVVITITGTNDAPTITSGAQTGSATERADHAVDENAYTHAASGAVTFNDVDTLDTHSASFAPQALGYLGSFTLDPVNQAGDSVGWSFSVADSVLDSLQAGQVLTQTYTVTVDDGHGGTVTQDVVITITGTNDAPTITSGAQTGSATERADHAVDENAYTHAASGAVTFNDVDTLDTHSASFAPQALGYLGSFTLDPVNQAGDSVGWSFSVADSVLDSLQAGQVLTQTYTVTVDDGHGGTVTQDVVITITGTNDAPTITSGAQTGSATERADHAVDENAYTHAASGAVTFNDVDTLDTHSASFAPQALGYLGSFTLDPVNQAGDSVGWSFSVADSVLDSLQAGQVLTQTYTVTVDDGHGGTVTQDVVITITGTNDAPTITSGAQTGSATERADHAVDENAYTHAASGAVAFNDVDTLDTHSASFAPQALGYLGSFTLDPVNQAGDSVGWSFSVADSVLDSLQAGQVLTQTYTVTVDDGHGGTVTQDVVITITGTNDAPTITSGAQAGTVTEDADTTASLSDSLNASGTVAFNDVDLIDLHSASFVAAASNTTALGTFALGSVSESATTEPGSMGWSYTLNNAAAQYLAAGQSATEIYTVTVDDGHGGTVTQDVTVTIAGTNDAPTATVNIAAIASDSGTSSSDFVTNDTSLTVSGTNTALGSGEKVQISSDGTTWFDVAQNTGTTWSYIDPTAHPANFTYQARVVDTAGNPGPVDSQAIVIDAAPPAAPVITSFANDTGSSNTDHITNDSALVINGTAEANSRVTVLDGVTNLGTVTADGAGNWTLNTGTLSDTTHNFTAIATDLAGNASGASTAFSVTVDTVVAVPAGLDLAAADDTLGVGTAGTDSDNLTKNTSSLTITGSGEEGAVVTLFDDANGNGKQGGTEATLGTGTVVGGTFSIDISLGNGTTHVVASQTDVAGNVSDGSTAIDIIVDTSAPAAPVVTSITADTGTNGTDEITSDNTLLINGTAAANSGVEVFQNGVSIGVTTANGAGAWTLDYRGTTLADNSYNFTATATDAAGNTSGLSAPLAVTVDTLAPTVAVNIVDASLNDGDTSSVVNFTFSDATTNFTAADITAVGGTVTGLSGSGTSYTATVTATDGFSGVGSVSVTAGSYTDTAGNAGATGSDAVAVDRLNPTVAVNVVDASLNDGDASSVVTFTFSEATTDFTAADISAVGGTVTGLSGSGTSYTATFTATDGFSGLGSVSVTAGSFTDAAGNAGLTGSDTVGIDRLNPTVTSVTMSDTALGIGDTSTVTITFSEAVTAFDNSDVTVPNGTLSTLTTANGGVTWTGTFTPTSGVEDATNVLTVASTYTDLAGNFGTGGSSANYTVDTVAPTVVVDVVDTSLSDGDTNSVVNFTFSEATTNFTAADIAVVGGTVSGLSGSGTAYTATFTATDGFSGTGSVSVTAGSYTDATGNAGAAGTDSVTIDRLNPTVTVTGTPLGNGIGSTSNITFQFSEAVTGFTATDVTVSSNRGTISNFTQVDGDTYTATLTRTVANASVTVSVTGGSYTDLALNAGAAGSSANLPAGAAGEPINLALPHPSADASQMLTVTIAGVPAGWVVNAGTDNGDGTWTVQTNDPGSLTVTTPATYSGALVLAVSMSWTNTDGSPGSAYIASNVEAYAPGSPIFAVSADDHLTASSAADLLVFAQPIANDTIHNFDAAADKIDLIGFAGVSGFADLAIADDANGNAVITLANGSTITVLGTHAADLGAANFEFNVEPVTVNTGTMTISDGAILPLGGVVQNSGTIALGSTGSETDLQVLVESVKLQGGGHVVLSDNSNNVIFGGAASATLNNIDNTISGAGQIGAGQMTLVNAGTIVADGTHALVIDTGSSAVSNLGTLEATGSGGLTIEGALANTGSLWANGGDVTVHGDVTGGGSALISGAATLEFGAASDANVVFDNGAAGVLALDHSADFNGSVSGFGSGDSIDLADVNFGSSLTADYHANDAGTGGTLTLSDGTNNSSIAIVGQYAAAGAQADGQGGTVLAYDAPALDHHMIGGASDDILVGGAGNDIIYGGAGADTLSGGSGTDTFGFAAAGAASVDTISDFTVGAGGDVLNISDLITGTFAGNEASYISLRESGGNTIVSIDRDGTGGAFDFQDFAVLSGVTGLNLGTLLTNGNIDWTP